MFRLAWGDSSVYMDRDAFVASRSWFWSTLLREEVMKISELSVTGVAGVPTQRWSLLSATGRPHDLVVITGPAGSGKTRLCDLIITALESIGPYVGVVRPEEWFIDPNRGACVDLHLWLTEDELAEVGPVANPSPATVHFTSDDVVVQAEHGVRRLVERYDHDPKHGKREYFPELRQPAASPSKVGLSPEAQIPLRVSKDPLKYSFVPQFLESLEGDPERRSDFAAALKRLSPNVQFSPHLRVTELPRTELDGVLIAATATLVGLRHSIVILDRPELHMPSERLIPFVEGLLSLDWDNQWILATADAQLAASVEPSQRIALR